jgi:hypothetical protein
MIAENGNLREIQMLLDCDWPTLPVAAKHESGDGIPIQAVFV